MSIRLTGILVDGLNNPLVNTTVTLIARSNTLLVLGGSEAVFRTDSTGHYNIQVNSGHYVVIVGPQGIEPYKAGEIVLYADSADGSLNGYLVDWVEEELTPDIIKQVQDLVASSQEYALQAERAASSANADATDARNSKAAAASSASSALTYKNDAKKSADAAKTSQTSAAGSANTATQAVTTIQGLKTDVEKLKSDTQTIKNSAVTETTKLKDAAAASATQAANSATEAGKQATNAGTSATAAKKDADRAKTEADRAETAASSTPEIQPLPDVWIPFNDSLDMITGFSPSYKKIVIGDDEITMPGDKIVKFKRASTATYVNKSGVFTIAEIDEPRFEREGLLIEGQRTNYLLNSNKPQSWPIHSSLNKEFSSDNFNFNYATVSPTNNIIGTTGGYAIINVATRDRFNLPNGESFTFSCRAKGSKCRLRARVAYAGDGGADVFSADAYLDFDSVSASVSGQTNLIRSKVEQRGEWLYFEVTYTADADRNAINCAFFFANKIREEPFYEDSTMTLATPQIELGSCASSFIVSGGTPTTRSSDVVTIPSQNNLTVRPFTVLCEVNKNWTTPPNIAPRIFDVGGHQINDDYLSLGFVSTGKLAANVGMIQPLIAVDGDKFVVGLRAKSDLSINAIFNGSYTTDPNGKVFGITATSYRFGGQTAAGSRHLFGHVRNFRIWFKELTDRQLKESV
ncbi:tail protein [Enterobacteria phage JenP2]|uniref:Tail fiber protein n=1 Tax=Enterobacteria phage JenP2 TaxID=1610838 RepID=A0A0E3M0V5_9CAUD|nr:tail protein [Enterobacteria phage JenP2]AKA60976.1 tail fiber protein [Enterobacteria phage JenP2]